MAMQSRDGIEEEIIVDMLVMIAYHIPQETMVHVRS